MILSKPRVREIRRTLEDILGRSIKDSEVIHHINGNYFDNRIENLKVMDRGDHGRYHYELKNKKVSLYGAHFSRVSKKQRPNLAKGTKQISLKKLYQLADEYCEKSSREFEERGILYNYLRYVWEHRND